MSMSRKDFNELAESLRELKDDLRRSNGTVTDTSRAFEAHVRRIAQLCKRHNPEFQFGKFYDAVSEVGVPVKKV